MPLDRRAGRRADRFVRRRALLLAAGALALPGVHAQGKAATGSATASTTAADAPASLPALLALIGGKRERRAEFIERRYSALTRAPLESRGRLLFRAPDRLEKQTLSPQRETVRIDGGTVTIEGLPVRGVPERRSLQLADIPLLAALVESLRATLAGDLARLQRHYAPRYRPLERGWELVLEPTDPQLAAAVARVVLRGRADAVATVEIVETGGDRTELSITPVA